MCQQMKRGRHWSIPSSLNHSVGCSIQASGGIERVCLSIRPAEAEAIRISEHELKSQEPMCSVELRKIP